MMELTDGMRNTLFGIGAVMVSNSCFLGNSFIIKHNPLTAGEIMITRSLLQIVIFGMFCLHKRKQEGPLLFGWNTWFMVAAANFTLTICQIMAYTAVKMLPLCDFVVLAFTSPVFALVASGILLRKPVRCIEVTLCMAIVLGAGLVSQPSFIFGQLSATPREEYYTLGAVLALIGAIAGGLFPVLMAKCKDVPSCFYMAAGGAVSLIVGAIHRTIMSNPEVDHYGSRLIGLLITVATMSMVGVLMKQMAVAATCPVLVTMVRSMEIVMALVVDIGTASRPIHLDDLQFWFKVIGACTVTVCVITMSVADKIHEGLLACTRAVIGQERDRSAYTIIAGEEVMEDDERRPLVNSTRSIA